MRETVKNRIKGMQFFFRIKKFSYWEKETAEKEQLWVKKRGLTDGMPWEVEAPGAIIEVEELTAGRRVSISS